MDIDAVRQLLADVRDGRVTAEAAVDRLRHLPFEDLGFAKLDHHRGLRCGFPEVVFCPGKTVEQVCAIVGRMVEHGTTILATRASREAAEAVCGEHREAVHHESARAIVIAGRHRVQRLPGTVALVSAGTSDQPVAEEARVTASLMGAAVTTHYDVGVAGIHRLLARAEAIQNANAIVAVAGMEGALASVVGGLVAAPVIAVPTSVGYGASFGGLSALLTMLNSCATGVSVVNIDNGYAAGHIAAVINRQSAAADKG